MTPETIDALLLGIAFLCILGAVVIIGSEP